MGINKDSETIFFINETLRLDKESYMQIRSGSRRLREFLPEPGDVRDGEAGSLFISRILPGENGLGNDQSKSLSHYTRKKFRNAYANVIGLPELVEAGEESLSFSPRTAFSSQPYLMVSTSSRNAVIDDCYKMLGSECRILWLDCKEIRTEKSFKEYFLQKFLLVTNAACKPNTFISAISLYSAKTPLSIVLENLPSSREPQYLSAIKELLKALSDNEHADIRMWFITDENEVMAAEILPGEKKLGISMVRKYKWYAFMISIVAMLLFAMHALPFTTRHAPKVLLFSHFSDENTQDDLVVGVHVVWLGKDNKTILQENSGYQQEYIIDKVPNGAVSFCITRGTSEIYPEIVRLNEIEEDTVHFDYYRTLVPFEKIEECIERESAQRWFVFNLHAPVFIKFYCTALDEKFLPQVAVYNNRFGRTAGRMFESQNREGKSHIDSTGGYLAAGKYYLKVRGYDKSTGSFNITSKTN